MNAIAQNLIDEFDLLDSENRREVVVEILRRVAGDGEIPEKAYAEIANEVFLMFDEEEASNGQR